MRLLLIGCTVFKLTGLPTSGTALDGTAARKRQRFRSRRAGAVWVMGTNFWGWYLFCGGGGCINCGTKTFAEEMNCAGGERGNRLTLFGTGLAACSGNACGREGAKRNAGGIKGKRVGTGFKTGIGRADIFMYVFGGLGAIGALASDFKGGGQGGLTKFNCPGMLDLRGNWWSNSKPSKCIVA